MQPPEVKPGPRTRRTKTAEEALAALQRLCARAERARSDALRLMRGWGLSEADAQRVLARLTAERFIDDRRYAEAFVREKLRLSSWGTYKIRAALRRKGIDREVIDTALAQADGPEMAARLEKQLRRKALSLRGAAPHELRTKLIRYGLSLGYDYAAVSEATSALTPDTDSCEDFY